MLLSLLFAEHKALVGKDVYKAVLLVQEDRKRALGFIGS